MKRIAVIAAALAVSMLSSAPAAAQAFGISAGDKVETLDVVRDIGEGKYLVNVPSPHPEFEVYRVTASDTAGTCLVVAAGVDHDRDRYGDSVRAAYEKVAAAIDKRYGKGLEYDHLRSGALWDDRDEWVMAIAQNERSLQMAWTPEYGSDLTDDITEILLTVNASSSSSSYLHLQYRFANYDACSAEISSQVDAVF
jgi:hypothetical protein